MTPSGINFLVNENGGQTAVAKEIGYTQSELAQVINGHRINEPLRDKLAAYLGVPKARLFDKEFEAVIAYKQEKKTA